ncbi:zf-HC2 domain-containing protein [Rhodoferax sp. WC2427]|uniref:anti-sigma factor family protein n=1 Tax=Rhodoferax sp. WC2427 TaxID=3234144 RepID=UPI0034665C18
MIPLRRTCKQAAALLLAREDRRIALSDTVALRLHLMACQACPRFERQLLTMRNAMRQWRNYDGGGGDDNGL